MSKTKVSGLLWVFFAYVLALGSAVFAMYYFSESSAWMKFILADIAATLVIFVFSVLFRNSSFYDPFWSLMPAMAAVWIWMQPTLFIGAEAIDADKNILLLVLMLVYGVRLTFNWARGWTGLDHEDWRYVDLAEKTGPFYWLVSFFGIHFFPSALTFLGSIPLTWAIYQEGALTGLQYIGLFVLLAGIIIEAVADHQLRQFRLSNTDPQKILNTGLWSMSRHPNYFGENLVWWGIAICGWAAIDQSPFEGNAIWIWNFAGAIAITLLFVFISIPMIDERMLARRPAYTERMKKVSALVLWPFSK